MLNMNIFAIILILISLLNLFLAMYTLKYRKNAMAFYSFGFLLSIAIYSFGYAFELSAGNLTDMLFWFRFEFIGIAFLPTFFVLLVIHYIGKEDYISKYLKWFCFLFSTFIIGIVFSNQYHGNFYHSLSINNSTSIPLMLFKPGIWFWVLQVYIIMSLTVSLILLYKILKSGKSFRFQALSLLLGAILPIISYMLYLTGYTPYGIDLCPFSFSFIGIFYALAILKFQLLDFVPPSIELIFENLSIGVVIIDNKSRITHINRMLRAIFPSIDKSNIGDNVNNVFQRIPSICSIINNEGNPACEIDILVNNKICHFHVSISNYINEKARLLGKMVVFTDITERKQSQLSLLESIAARDKFFSIIAHDLKNPFNALINLSKIAADKNLSENDHEKCIQMINSTSHNAYDLLSDLLTWAMTQREMVAFEPEAVELTNIFDTTIRSTFFLAGDKSITVKSELIQHVYIDADRNMLLTILRNLVTNALKFTNKGGMVILNAVDNTNEIVVSVTDNGIGMSETKIQNLFRIGHKQSDLGTSQEMGTGLGLIICSELVKKHNGRIWVDSKPEKGSTFYFSIPRISNPNIVLENITFNSIIC